LNEKSTDNTMPNIFNDFPSLDVATLLANPVAYVQNKRFIDADLNREFSVEKLKRVVLKEQTNGEAEECQVANEFCSGNNADLSVAESLPHEAIRAREIEQMLGPKLTSEDADPNGSAEPLTDVIVDLHTTTANMGISLIIPEGDPLMAAAAAYVLNQCKTKYGYDSVQCLMHAMPTRADRQNLSSCGRHGFTVEVGPVPQGVLRHDVIEKTQSAMHSLLEFLHLRNLELQKGGRINGEPTVLDELRRVYPNNIVPCYRSAPAVRPGELSGKISWPNDETNPNFPSVIVHKSLQDQDFKPLRIGDPLFVSLDGTVIPYDGSHGDEVHLIFVNEGGYYYASSKLSVLTAVDACFESNNIYYFLYFQQVELALVWQ
jgi:aspartoacylase